MKKLLPSLLPLVALLATALAPAAQAWISTHPVIALSLTTLGSVINHWIPAPTQ